MKYVALEYELSGFGSPTSVSEADHCFLVDDEGLDEPMRRAGARYFDANRKDAGRTALEALHVR